VTVSVGEMKNQARFALPHADSYSVLTDSREVEVVGTLRAPLFKFQVFDLVRSVLRRHISGRHTECAYYTGPANGSRGRSQPTTTRAIANMVIATMKLLRRPNSSAITPKTSAIAPTAADTRFV